MTAIISWNIQSGRGVDGIIDLDRIAQAIRAMGQADVICLQEVARFVPEIADGADQLTALADRFPEYTAFFGAAIDRLGAQDGPRRAFGNLILTRLPALQLFQHSLPQPPDPMVKSMPRQASEIVVAKSEDPLRIITTHLEYFSASQRSAQIEYLRFLHTEVGANAQKPPATPGQGIFAPAPRPASLVICGDFNCPALSPQYERILAPFPAETPSLCDAWTRVYPGQPHAPTCGVFDREQWQEGPHCRDFFFVTEDIAPWVETVEVNVATRASDHQPLRLVLRD